MRYDSVIVLCGTLHVTVAEFVNYRRPYNTDIAAKCRLKQILFAVKLSDFLALGNKCAYACGSVECGYAVLAVTEVELVVAVCATGEGVC